MKYGLLVTLSMYCSLLLSAAHYAQGAELLNHQLMLYGIVIALNNPLPDAHNIQGNGQEPLPGHPAQQLLEVQGRTRKKCHRLDQQQHCNNNNKANKKNYARMNRRMLQSQRK